jgi:hypothetical protein
MLILIDSSVVDDGDENTWDDETVVALDNLATAHREGKHLVIADRKTSKKIARCSRLSENKRNVYKHLCNQATQNFRSYPSVVKRYIEVKPCLKPQVVEKSGQKIIEVPPRFFNDSESIQKTILLCENLDDAVFYETIAKVYLIWKHRNVPIVCVCEPRGGGGNTISSEYINIQKQKKRFCLCIVDSDKIAPDGKLGDTALGLRKSDSTCTNTQAFILDCREIENLIPNSILSELSSGNPQRLEALKILESSSVVEVRCFLDIKQGTRLKEIIDAKNLKVKDFWQLKLGLIPNISERIDDWCQTHWQCSNNSKKSSKNSKKSNKNSKEKCDCQISLGLGENTLSNTVEYLKRINNPHEIARIVDRSMRSDWEKIGEVVMDWCIAESPIRA